MLLRSDHIELLLLLLLMLGLLLLLLELLQLIVLHDFGALHLVGLLLLNHS